MYIPKLYREEDREKILEFLHANNFPALVTHDGEKPIATHLPVCKTIPSRAPVLSVLFPRKF